MSKIEWTGVTWNPVLGCSVISPGCTNCYAMRMAARLDAMAHAAAGKRNDATESLGPLSHYLYLTQSSKAGPVWTGKVASAPDHILLKPMTWKKPRTVFVNSMGDLFHENVPEQLIDRVFAVMALTPHHTYQVLTKRSARMLAYLSGKGIQERLEQEMLNWIAYLPKPWDYTTGNGEHLPRRRITCHDPVVSWPLPNIWCGVSAEDQPRYDERKEDLRNTPAAVHFFSFEPLLGAIVGNYFGEWAIVGGESGKGARPMQREWAESIVRQCKNVGVAVFVKQLGSAYADAKLKNTKGGDMNEWPETLRVREMPATPNAETTP